MQTESTIWAWRGDALEIIYQGDFQLVGEIKAQLPDLAGVMECDENGSLLEHAILMSSQTAKVKPGGHYLAFERTGSPVQTEAPSEDPQELTARPPVVGDSHSIQSAPTPIDDKIVEWFDEVTNSNRQMLFREVMQRLVKRGPLPPVPDVWS
ncbi:hypothetical protein XU18_0697 [Perkinsela sp. CCAP 1560/4]|nr:hypothetical protein XU18_4503 [Perkinsela sp. CCAP 1560/4]KNH08927.1 hypothetical protein XU18_0697 [Perkinsela sp. CCAP 1560/4]|eukprot:KNH04293.1 hypothetical protein XU18_4503 [Perkinsela sp. CCAP 1560/4]